MNGTKKKSSPEILLFKELLKPVHSSPLSLFLPYTNNPSSTLFVHCAIFLTYKSNPFSLLLKVIQWIPTLHTHIQKNYICRCQKNTCYVPSSSLQFRLTYTYSMLQTKNKYCIFWKHQLFITPQCLSIYFSSAQWVTCLLRGTSGGLNFMPAK